MLSLCPQGVGISGCTLYLLAWAIDTVNTCIAPFGMTLEVGQISLIFQALVSYCIILFSRSVDDAVIGVSKSSQVHTVLVRCRVEGRHIPAADLVSFTSGRKPGYWPTDAYLPLRASYTKR